MPNKYYKKNKGKLQKEAHERYRNQKSEKKARERYKVFLKKKKKKSVRIIVNVMKILLEIENKNQSSIEEIII